MLTQHLYDQSTVAMKLSAESMLSKVVTSCKEKDKYLPRKLTRVKTECLIQSIFSVLCTENSLKYIYTCEGSIGIFLTIKCNKSMIYYRIYLSADITFPFQE